MGELNVKIQTAECSSCGNPIMWDFDLNEAVYKCNCHIKPTDGYVCKGDCKCNHNETISAGKHLELDRDIYKETIDKWGEESQFWMAAEEMGELLQKLSHFQRGRCSEIDVAEEIADCFLMLEEMAYIFGREHVIKWIGIKKKVVTQRLDEETFRPAHDIIKER